MQKHVKNYLEYHGLYEGDPLACEVCGKVGIIPDDIDIHHIEPKGMGGSKLKDNPENLIALCRTCHEYAHDQNTPSHRDYLRRCRK